MFFIASEIGLQKKLVSTEIGSSLYKSIYYIIKMYSNQWNKK